MKVYKKQDVVKKNWSLRLSEYGEHVRLLAVDSKTGERLATLISFGTDGLAETFVHARRALLEQGYDPYEHGNNYDEYGRLIIK